MVMTYKEDMLAALEHFPCLKRISTLYENWSLEAQKKQAFRHAESKEQEKMMMLRVHLTSSVIFKVCIMYSPNGKRCSVWGM